MGLRRPLVNHPPHSELHLDAAQLIFADAYVLLGLAALALTAVELRAERRLRRLTLAR
jgi:hypothetical protein